MRVGFARADITCAPGTLLGGNARADKAARGVHDPLHASIMVIEDAETQVALIGCDLVAVTAEFTNAVAAQVARVTGWPERTVHVFATHTHSGPDTIHGFGFDDADYSTVARWSDETAPEIAHAASEAYESLADSTIERVTVDVPGFAFHRRLRTADGEIRMNWSDVTPDSVEPAGPVDDELTALVVRADGIVTGVLVHFALHPAILVGHDWLVSADFIGPLTERLRERFGPVPVVFANGALGNINHLDFREPGRAIGFAESDRVGNGLAELAFHGFDTAPTTPQDGLWTDRFTVQLSQRTVDAERLAWARDLLGRAGDAPADALDGIPEAAYAQWTLTRGVALQASIEVDVSLVGIGQTVLVLLPFEVFVEFGLRLRDDFPDLVVKVVSLAGDYLGYLPTAEAFDEGGYEPTFGTSTIARGQGEELFARIRERILAASTTTRPGVLL